MAKFVFDSQEAEPEKSKEDQPSRYDKTTSGKVLEEVATEQAIWQQRYEQDHIAYLYASEDNTEIETHSELTQTHQPGTQSNIEYRAPEIHQTWQGDSIEVVTNQHERSIEADDYTEDAIALRHYIDSMTAHLVDCPTTESYSTDEDMVFNTSQYTLTGSDSQTQADTAGGVATTGINQHGTMKVSTADYQVKSASAIDFAPAAPAPKLRNVLHRRIRQNQFDYDEVKWHEPGYFQVVDMVVDLQNQQWYLFDEPIAQCQLGRSSDCLSVRQDIDQPIIEGDHAQEMLKALDILSELKAFDEASQMIELIHMSTAHVSYMRQSDLSKLTSDAAEIDSAVFDDDKQSVDFDSLVQNIASQHPDEQFENLFADSSAEAYQSFCRLTGLKTPQSLLDPQQYHTTPQARLMRYAMGLSNQLGFNQQETALPLTQRQLIQTDYAKGEAIVEGHFPHQQGNVVMPKTNPPKPQGCFVAELRFELAGFAGGAFLLSPENNYQGCIEEDNPSYPYLQTQSTHPALQSVDYGNKVTGQLGWMMQTIEQIADHQPRDDFSIIAEAGGSATLSESTPETFRIEYYDQQFYIAMNSAWLFETVKLSKQPKSKGTVMPFVVTYETFLSFIQFAYYQLLDRDYLETTDMIDSQTLKQLNELMAYGVWGYCDFGSLYKDHEQSIEAVKNKVTANELNRNDLADAINSETFADIFPFATAYVKGRWLYTLLNGSEQTENTHPNRQQIAQAVKQTVGWIQTDQENKHVMQHYVPFSNDGKTSFAAGSKQFERDKAGL